MFGNNIKVHFAGAEQIDFSSVLHSAGVNYFLFTCFPFVCAQFGIRGYPVTTRNFFPPEHLQKISKHLIMDSGLFTLMFGAHAGKRDGDFVYQWQEALCEFVLGNDIKCTCVEVDCQKVLGVEEAWHLRQRLRETLPNRIINVFHYEDGMKGLDRLIEFSDYLAISVPELRIVRKGTYRQDTIRLAHYIKSKKPGIDIHLLGCTEAAILRHCRFCTSADSTSWQQINRYGSCFGKSVREAYYKNVDTNAIAEILRGLGIEPTNKRIAYYSNYFISGLLHKQKYTLVCGSQE